MEFVDLLRSLGVLEFPHPLSSDGMHLEGIRRILALENQVSVLQNRVHELEAELAEASPFVTLP